MLDVDTPVGRAENEARQRYLQRGVHLSVSDLTDTLGGYHCEIVRADAENVWISLPLRRDGMLTLGEGQLVTGRFDRPGDAVYSFDTVVAAARDEDEAPFGLARPATINRRPRRSAARLALVLPARFDGEDVEDGDAQVVDVSAGGVGMICDHEFVPDDRVRVRCTLPGEPDDVQLDEPARVQTASIYGRTPGGTTLHHYGLRFVEITEAARDQILDNIIWNLTAHPAAD